MLDYSQIRNFRVTDDIFKTDPDHDSIMDLDNCNKVPEIPVFTLPGSGAIPCYLAESVTRGLHRHRMIDILIDVFLQIKENKAQRISI